MKTKNITLKELEKIKEGLRYKRVQDGVNKEYLELYTTIWGSFFGYTKTYTTKTIEKFLETHILF